MNNVPRDTLQASKNTIYEILRTNLSAKKMQNKPNFQNVQMTVRPYKTKDYEKIFNRTIGENKPNQTQSQTGAAMLLCVVSTLRSTSLWTEGSTNNS